MANPLTVQIGTAVNFMIPVADAAGAALPNGTNINTSSDNGSVAQPTLDFTIAGQVGSLTCPVNVLGIGTAVLTATATKPDGKTGSGSAKLIVTEGPDSFTLICDLVAV